MEMKKCKECGKMFLPRGRESYCSADHYRPCPVCGAPTLVKYFSDPPRKCDACKYRKVAPLPKELAMKSKSFFNFIPEGMTGGEALKQEVDLINQMEDKSPGSALGWANRVETTIPDTIDQSMFCENLSGTVRMYVGNAHKNNFIPGHEYLLKVERDEYCYTVHSTEDITTGEDCDITMHYASQISFHQNFKRLKQRGEHSGIGHNGW